MSGCFRFLWLIIFIITIYTSTAQKPDNIPPLTSYYDVMTDHCGYKNKFGEIVIEPQFQICHTDPLIYYAIVLTADDGWIGIDRKGKFLYRIFTINNEPDQPSEGKFRILKNTLIGYADSGTGKVIIKPKYQCAYPFENGKAIVSRRCYQLHAQDGSMSWKSDNWKSIGTNQKIKL